MKPAAIGATLLLHTVTLGAIAHFGADQHTIRTGLVPLEIVMLSGSSVTNAAAFAPEKTVVARNLAASSQATTTSHSIEPQTTSDAATSRVASKPGSDAWGAGETSHSASGSPSGAPEKSGVSIPAGYAASNRKPTYPLISVKQEEQGTVLLRILVKADGTAGEVHVKRSSGHPLLDQSALSAVQEWRFHPASNNNKPVSEWYQLAIPFKLSQL